MIRFSRSLLSRRNELVGNYILSKDKGSFWFSTSVSHGTYSAGSDFVSEGSYGGASADYTIFKGKAALSVRPKLPKFSKLDSGFSRVEKTGAVFLTFWPAIGQRKYDWEKKQVFAANPTEVGSLISLGPTESCDFLHDPSMKSSLEGQVKKSLAITPLNNNDGGYFFTLTVTNSVQKTNERFSVPVTKAEFTVLRTALSYALPRIMGWDKVVGVQLPSTGSSPSKQQYSERRPDPFIEWGR